MVFLPPFNLLSPLFGVTVHVFPMAIGCLFPFFFDRHIHGSIGAVQLSNHEAIILYGM